MANPEHLRILEQGVQVWNAWRDRNRDIRPNLSEARFWGTNLNEVKSEDLQGQSAEYQADSRAFFAMTMDTWK